MALGMFVELKLRGLALKRYPSTTSPVKHALAINKRLAKGFDN